jgi:AcrR family transcriptional regulator
MPQLIDHASRRAAYAEATWRVIEDGGLARVTVRSVAGEAGVSAGSLRHLFPTQSSLLAFAMELVAQRVEARVRAIQPVADPVQSAVNLLAEILPLDEVRRTESRAWLAFSAAAVGDAELAGIRRQQFDALAGLCRTIVGDLREAGRLPASADLRFEARRLHALVDGLTVHAVTEDAEWTLGVLSAHLRSLDPQQERDGS